MHITYSVEWTEPRGRPGCGATEFRVRYFTDLKNATDFFQKKRAQVSEVVIFENVRRKVLSENGPVPG